ncbi:uncharacterized protein LOC110483776 [Lonchura striata]
MAEEQIRKPLEFHISNNTQVTLKYHRTAEDLSCSHLLPELLGGSSDSYHVFSTSNALGRGWLVIYEASSFTLAVFFFLRSHPELLPTTLHLELSTAKVHLGHFRETFDRLTLQQEPPDPAATAVARAQSSGRGDAYVRLGAGAYGVLATAASRRARPLLRVEVEERHFVFPPLGSAGPPPAPPESCGYCQKARKSSGTSRAPLEASRNV